MPGKKFQFKLEAVLRLRRQETTAARKELAEAMDAVQAAQARLESAREALKHLPETGPHTSLAELRRSADYAAHAVDAVEEAENRVAAAQNVRESSRKALARCMQAEEALENLKTHQQEEFEAAQAKAEQSLLDDLGVIAHLRNKPQLA